MVVTPFLNKYFAKYFEDKSFPIQQYLSCMNTMRYKQIIFLDMYAYLTL